MSTVNVMAKEIAAKVVFYGPGLSGKTTTLKKIYDSVKPAHRGELMSLPTEADRTLLFDFLPVKIARVGPDFETCATSGQGVLEALKAVMRLVIRDLRSKRVVPAAKNGASEGVDLEGQLRQHLPTNLAPSVGRPAIDAAPLATPARGM